MKKRLYFIIFICLGRLCNLQVYAQSNDFHTFHGIEFSKLPVVWDEGIPLGNGITGALIWEKVGKLRLALDRADLWDLRPVKEFNSPSYSYEFVCNEIIQKRDVTKVQELIDARTRKDIAPTKIPAGAIEFTISQLGKIKSVTLDVHSAICTIRWENGTIGQFFTGATDKTGYFKFENLPDALPIDLQTPRFEEDGKQIEYADKNRTNMLTRLGYKNGKIKRGNNSIVYRQQAYGNISYEIAMRWNYTDKHTLEGVYCLTSKGTWYSEPQTASKILQEVNLDSTCFDVAKKEHLEWWNNYWTECEINLPDDPVLENQWYLEMYKFGAASRKNAPPICLQAVWTADNGQTPPWRGDFHNDLNTQLSYWPGYASNHPVESSVFTDWLWKIKDNSEKFTRKFFGVEGLNVACIATLEGEAIGGWSPYSHQPTTSGWLAQHFYLQWKYTADHEFLKEQAYPWIKEVAHYFENISVIDTNGKRKLPLSTSPEINDNRLEAWFQQTTNYDLAAIRFAYTAAIEMATSLGLTAEAKHWEKQLQEWPDFATDLTGLTIAPDYPQKESHRHFSHLLAFHPLGLLDVSQGKTTEQLIKRSIHHVEELGSTFWTGYTYTWLANMKARVFDGDAASRALHIFIKAFCSPNSFHLNGDQIKKGYSSYDYRPFTLEGNFACASGIQEMLLQSHTGIIRVFPAIPEDWKNASFHHMRAMGAFLISAEYKDGKVRKINVHSEKGGLMKIFNPFSNQVEERKMEAGENLFLCFHADAKTTPETLGKETINEVQPFPGIKGSWKEGEHYDFTYQDKAAVYQKKQHCNVRGSLTNSLIRFEKERKGRVAFFGGSITEMSGWRNMIQAQLKQRFPFTEFEFVDAGLPSAGTTPHAFRMENDVLSGGDIDLLFIEGAVNDHTNGFSPQEQIRGMEGVIRHALTVNPFTDIIMLHFVYEPFLQMFPLGQTPDVILNHERVANYYLIPSINCAQEISERIEDKEFTWEEFGGVHPKWFGHKFYAAGIQALWDAMWSLPENVIRQKHELPGKALDEYSYTHGKFIDLKEVKLQKGWDIVPIWKPKERVGTREGFVNVPMLYSNTPGATFSFHFKGTAVGLFMACGPYSGIIEYSIDGGKFRKLDTYTAWSKGLYLPWLYVLAAELDGQSTHKLTVCISKDKNVQSKGTECVIRNLVINRSLN